MMYVIIYFIFHFLNYFIIILILFPREHRSILIGRDVHSTCDINVNHCLYLVFWKPTDWKLDSYTTLKGKEALALITWIWNRTHSVLSAFCRYIVSFFEILIKVNCDF